MFTRFFIEPTIKISGLTECKKCYILRRLYICDEKNYGLWFVLLTFFYLTFLLSFFILFYFVLLLFFFFFNTDLTILCICPLFSLFPCVIIVFISLSPSFYPVFFVVIVLFPFIIIIIFPLLLCPLSSVSTPLSLSFILYFHRNFQCSLHP